MNTKVRYRSMAFMMVALTAASSFAEIVHHDDKDFWVDGESVEHQLFYAKGNAVKIYSPSTYSDQEFQNQSDISSDGILVTLQTQTYSGVWSFGNCTCYGMDFRQKLTKAIGKVFHIGAYGIHSSLNDWTLQFYDGAIRLTDSQTWSGPESAELSASPLVIKSTHDTLLGSKGGVVADVDDVVLTLSGDLRLWLRDETSDLSRGDVVVRKPAVLSLQRHSGDASVSGRLHARKLTLDGGSGFYFGAKTMGDAKGSIAELSVERVAQTVELRNNASLTAYGATTVSVTGGVTVAAATGTVSPVIGSYVLEDDATVFRADAGGTLDLTGATLTGGALSVQGPGTVNYDFDKNMTAGGVSFGGGCSLAFSGCDGRIESSLAGVSAIEISVSGVMEIRDAAMASYHGSDIVVSSGTLYVPSASSIPAGVKIVTSGTGVLCLRDATGFDKAVQMGGTRELSDGTSGLLVTDASRAGETIVVEDGETLTVLGNGLKSSNTVDLRGNSRIAFYDTATVAASFVATNGAVDVVTMGSAVTGTVSGAVNSQGGTLRVTSPGLVRILGGGQLGGFRMLSGEAEVGGADYLGYGTIAMVSGHLLVTSTWQYDTKWIDVDLAQTQTGDATLEIGPGGDLYLARANCNIFIGKDSNWKSRLYLNGGVLSCPYNERLCMNCSFDGKGVKTDYAGNGIIEIDNSGELATTRMIRSGGQSGEYAGIILGNGTWSSRKATTYRYQYSTLVGEGDCPVTVKGFFTFDMSNFRSGNDVVTNQSAEATGVWRCEKGGRVSVTGGRTLVFRDVPEMALDLTNASAGNVVFCNSTEVDCDVPPTAVTWTVPADGSSYGTVTAVGEKGMTGPLVASYIIPDGVTFDGSQTNGWYEGFTEQSLSNLTFEVGSAYRFAPFAADFAPLELAGSLTVPETLDYYLMAGTSRAYRGEPVIVPAGGVVGTCVWTCKGDKTIYVKCATLATTQTAALFDYESVGFMVIVR